MELLRWLNLPTKMIFEQATGKANFPSFHAVDAIMERFTSSQKLALN